LRVQTLHILTNVNADRKADHSANRLAHADADQLAESAVPLQPAVRQRVWVLEA